MEEEVIAILDDDKLLRRVIYTDPSYVKDDMTVTSFAFKLRKGESGLSVDIEKLTTYEKSIVNIEKYRLFALIAKDIRALELECIHNPIQGNYAHAEIKDLSTNKVSSELAKKAQYVHYPPTNL